MTRRVIYVSFIRLTDKVARDWYVDFLIQQGYDVEYWDIVGLVREEHEEAGAQYLPHLRRLASFAEFEEQVRRPQNRDAIYVMLISYAARFSRVFRLLTRYNRRMVFIAWGAMPTSPMPLRRRLFSRHYNPVRLAAIMIDRVKAAAYRRLNLVKRFDVVFAAGRVLLESDLFAAKVVPINLCDYDHYVTVAGRNDRLVEGHYAVFLDINLPFQSDLKMAGLTTIEPDDYYRSLNRFFAMLELRFGVKVVIAAHPKADYHSDLFQSRQVRRNVTAALVRDADIVITHTSTALSYAVLNHKPVLFIYTEAMRSAYKVTVMRELETLAKYLDAELLNIDRIVANDDITVRKVNKERYDAYKYDFLTSPGSEHSATSDIFLRELNADLQVT